jgi:hypothetical protein
VQQIRSRAWSRLAFQQEYFGDGFQRVLASLPEGYQRTLRTPFTSTGILRDGKALDDDRRVFGAVAVEPSRPRRLKNLRPRASYLPGATPTASRASPFFYSLYYETGRREYTPVGPEGVLLPRRRDLQRAGLSDGGRVVPEGAGDVRVAGVRIVEECRAKAGTSAAIV